jgi:membrane protein DedA with SNARE-associated domain/rhodanese-related sulfurtransferase
METLVSQVSLHGYAILFAIVFLEAIAIPVPAALALLIAGGASTTGALHPAVALACALAALLLGDISMFLMGRYTGWWLLGLICRLSFNPESCILRAADSFYRRGRTLLVFAKFVPGINTIAPPLAGSMNMRFAQFLRFDLVGASLYAGAYFLAGFLFSDTLGKFTSGYLMFSRVAGWALFAAAGVYVAMRVWLWTKARDLRSVPFVTPADAARAWSSGLAAIYDVRSHGYYNPKAMRIRSSKRLDPNALNQSAFEIPAGKQIFVYCTCVREATSARVAQLLLEKGVPSAVIKGGLRAWIKAGLPVEAVPAEEVELLPIFDQ